MTPVRLDAEFKEKIWGSHNVAPWYVPDGRAIGEVWFTHHEPLPLLVKFIFTEEKLSVQVHPDDAYAREHENSHGKTEMWYILRAAPGAKIALGFRQPIPPEDLRPASLSGEIERLLNWEDARPGDTFFTPAGTVHAIGAGIALCEIQQQSDVTYRLYDYDRGRELHLDRGVEVSDTIPYQGRRNPVPLPSGWELLAECPYFRTERRTSASQFDYEPSGHGDDILIFLAGEGNIAGQPFRLGEAWLCAAPFPIEPAEEVTMLRTFVP